MLASFAEAWATGWAEVLILVQSVISLYIVVNPSGASSVFMGLTKDLTRAERFGIALRACIAGFVILTVFGLSGTFLFSYLKITGWSLRVAGGIIMFAFAFNLVRGREKEFFGLDDPDTDRSHHTNMAYYPLAVPLLASPASIMLVITLSPAGTDVHKQTMLLVSIAIVCGIAFLNMLRLALRLEKKGPGLALVMPRIWGMILAIISVQFIVEGVTELLPSMARAWQSGLVKP
ncbi:MAG: MarC family protein [Planctomycetota bacterium]|jgi:multiple antibiotic resistance protein